MGLHRIKLTFWGEGIDTAESNASDIKRQINWRLSNAMLCQATVSCEVTHYLSVHTGPRCCKHPLRGGSTKHSPCLDSHLATILTIKEVMSCLHLRVLPRPTAGTVLGQHAAEGLLLILSLLVPEPWKARLVAADVFHRLLLRSDVQLDASKQLQLPIPLHIF